VAKDVGRKGLRKTGRGTLVVTDGRRGGHARPRLRERGTVGKGAIPLKRNGRTRGPGRWGSTEVWSRGEVHAACGRLKSNPCDGREIERFTSNMMRKGGIHALRACGTEGQNWEKRGGESERRKDEKKLLTRCGSSRRVEKLTSRGAVLHCGHHPMEKERDERSTVPNSENSQATQEI